MGVAHIFMTVPFHWGGEMMTTLLRMLRNYIEEGRLSVNSYAVDQLDFVYSLNGLSWSSDVLQYNQVQFLKFVFNFNTYLIFK